MESIPTVVPFYVNNFKGIKIEVISEGHILTQYRDPEVGKLQGDYPDRQITSHYIQVITGAKFAVHVTITRAFKFFELGQDDAIEVIIHYDGGKPGIANNTLRRQVENLRRENQDTVLKFPYAWEYSNDARQYVYGETAFSALVIDEDSNQTNISPQRLKDLGSIVVNIMRGHRHLLQTPRTDFLVDEPISTVSEKAMKGKAVGDITRIQNASTRTPIRTHDFTPIKGPGGKLMQAFIRYRSKSTLQSLGCMRRTPTPEPGLSEENRLLKERLAALEGNSAEVKIKVEGSRSTPIKREGDAAGDDNDRKRRRRSEIEIVDLTED